MPVAMLSYLIVMCIACLAGIRSFLEKMIVMQQYWQRDDNIMRYTKYHVSSRFAWLEMLPLGVQVTCLYLS